MEAQGNKASSYLCPFLPPYSQEKNYLDIAGIKLRAASTNLTQNQMDSFYLCLKELKASGIIG